MKENDNKYKAVELSDEELAQVSGGGPSVINGARECGGFYEITSDGICTGCHQGNPCCYCQFRAPWCQEPILYIPIPDAPDDGK